MTTTGTDLNTLTIVWQTFGRYRRRFAVIPVASFLAGMADALSVVVLAQVALSLAQPGADFPQLGDFGLSVEFTNQTALLLVGGLTLIRFLLQMVATWAAAGVVADVNIRARQSALDVFIDASWSQQSRFLQGELQQLSGEPVTRMASMTSDVTKLMTAGLNLLALLISALIVDVRALLMIVVAGTVLFVVFVPMVRFGRDMSLRERDALRLYSTDISEIESMALEIQTFDVGAQVKGKVRHRLVKLRQPMFRRHVVQPMLPYTYQSAVFLVAAAALALLLKFDPGDLAAVGAIALLVVKSLGHAQSLQASWQRLHISLPYVDQLQQAQHLHRSQPADTGSVTLGPVERIEARDLTLRYDGDDNPALDGVDFTIHRGESIGVIGPSGSGKTSLMHLLLRLRQPSAGVLEVNGTDLAMVALDCWYQKVALVPQDCQLCHGSIGENIAFHREGFSIEQIENAARGAGIHDYIAALPDRYDTALGPRGSGLSGGQRQRIAIARALLGEPEVLVMDEPTSALDSTAEAAIAETLQQLGGSITTIVVAHRFSTVAHCDRVMVFSAGHLTGFGPADELAQANPTYRALASG